MRLLPVWIILAALLMTPAVGLTARSLDTVATAEQPQPPKEFVPVDDVPPGEQIPAFNLLAAAYGFAWIGVLGYVWSIARRLRTVEAELAELESRKR